jgi:hypothetical protein
LSLNGQLGSIMMRSMVIDMNDEQLRTMAQMQAFLDGTVALEFAVAVEERYGFIARTVRRFGYGPLADCGRFDDLGGRAYRTASNHHACAVAIAESLCRPNWRWLTLPLWEITLLP